MTPQPTPPPSDEDRWGHLRKKLMLMTRRELQQMAKEYHVKANLKTAKLIDRILDAVEKEGQAESASAVRPRWRSTTPEESASTAQPRREQAAPSPPTIPNAIVVPTPTASAVNQSIHRPPSTVQGPSQQKSVLSSRDPQIAPVPSAIASPASTTTESAKVQRELRAPSSTQGSFKQEQSLSSRELHSTVVATEPQPSVTQATSIVDSNATIAPAQVVSAATHPSQALSSPSEASPCERAKKSISPAQYVGSSSAGSELPSENPFYEGDFSRPGSTAQRIDSVPHQEVGVSPSEHSDYEEVAARVSPARSMGSELHSSSSDSTYDGASPPVSPLRDVDLAIPRPAGGFSPPSPLSENDSCDNNEKVAVLEEEELLPEEPNPFPTLTSAFRYPSEHFSDENVTPEISTRLRPAQWSDESEQPISPQFQHAALSHGMPEGDVHEGPIETRTHYDVSGSHMNAIAPENEPAFEADDDSEPNIIVSGGSAGLGERADDSEPAPPKRLKRTVRVIEAISQITSAAYKDTRVYEETAEYLLWEIQSLRATLKQECNCTTSMFQYLAWWQSSKSRWTNTELYGSMVKARQRPDGKYEEIYSDEEPVSGDQSNVVHMLAADVHGVRLTPPPEPTTYTRPPQYAKRSHPLDDDDDSGDDSDSDGRKRRRYAPSVPHPIPQTVLRSVKPVRSPLERPSSPISPTLRFSALTQSKPFPQCDLPPSSPPRDSESPEPSPYPSEGCLATLHQDDEDSISEDQEKSAVMMMLSTLRQGSSSSSSSPEAIDDNRNLFVPVRPQPFRARVRNSPAAQTLPSGKIDRKGKGRAWD